MHLIKIEKNKGRKKKMGIIWTIGNSFWFQAIIKLILGFVLAGIIGLERSSWSKPAGFRTHALVGISAVLIMLCRRIHVKHI